MRRLPLLVLLATLFVPAAHAQIVSVYGTFSPAHLSGIRNGSTGNSAANAGVATTDFWAPGVGGGVTLNFLPIGPVKLGFDLRGATRPGSQGYDLGEFGLRLGIKVPFVSFKPYLQASGGYLATRVDYTTPSGNGSATTVNTTKFAVYQIIGGIDYGILPFIDLRLVEVGAGQGFDIGGISFSPQIPAYRPTLFTVNTGIVVHF